MQCYFVACRMLILQKSIFSYCKSCIWMLRT